MRVSTAGDDITLPIRLSADQIIGWSDGNLDILLARGNVLLEQGLLRLRMREAVVWMNGSQARRGQPLRLWGYGEEVRLGEGANAQTAKTVLFDLQTRAEFRLQNQQMEKRSAATDPLYRRALAAWQTPPVPETPPVQPPNFALPAKPAQPEPPAKPEVPPAEKPAASPPQKPSTPGPSSPGTLLPRSGANRLRSIRIAPSGNQPVFPRNVSQRRIRIRYCGPRRSGNLRRRCRRNPGH
jgi:hypothetical protein